MMIGEEETSPVAADEAQSGPTLHRCFYALRFDPAVHDYLNAIVDDLRRYGADITWVRSENLHVTLRFLGEITDEQLEHALAIPRDGLIDTFTINAHGLGAFPGLRIPKILWAGVGSPSDEDRARFHALQSQTEQWARAIGVAHEHRRFRPHVTIGRVRRPGDNLREVIDEITTRECKSPETRVKHVDLLRSTKRGIYETVGRWGMRLGD